MIHKPSLHEAASARTRPQQLHFQGDSQRRAGRAAGFSEKHHIHPPV
jgi:hypothetical protein